MMAKASIFSDHEHVYGNPSTSFVSGQGHGGQLATDVCINKYETAELQSADTSCVSTFWQHIDIEHVNSLASCAADLGVVHIT